MHDEFKGFEAGNITLKGAGTKEIKVLAEMNRELIRDENGKNPMDLEQLFERMHCFLETGYKAVIIHLNSDIAGYCLYRLDGHGFDIFVRHFYIKPAFRRRGDGSKAFRLLLENYFKGAVS